MTVTAPETAATAPSTESPQTFESALDAMFARETAPAVETPAAEQQTGEVTETPAETATTDEVVPAVETPAAAPAVSASDYALKLARIKKHATKAVPPAPAGPSAEAVKRAQAIEEAGGDPLKVLAALNLDIPAILKAHDAKAAEDPEEYDPAMKRIAQLEAKLAVKEKAEAIAETKQIYANFHATAKQVMSSSGDAFEYTAAEGDDGLALVTSLVEGAADEGDVLPLVEALKIAEAHYEKKAAALAATKKHQKQFAPAPVRAPAIGTAPVLAGKAPARTDRPKTVSEALDAALDALGVK